MLEPMQCRTKSGKIPGPARGAFEAPGRKWGRIPAVLRAPLARVNPLAEREIEDPDRSLVEQAKADLPYGTTAFNELVRKYSSRVYARSYGILRSTADAEEAVQDVFLAVFRHLPRYRFERPFLHWLNTVTLNACRMILRKRASEARRRRASQEKAPPPEKSVSPDPALRKLVLELLDELDPGTRMPLIMRFVEGYSYPEIAGQLDMKESAVKMRVSRGAKKLRELYEERLGEEEARALVGRS
jgi:RNA polymerase sigma-70 factor (ECF subfamily)